ncbi:MAG: flagellar basal body P-ring formation chaperone FlgA [Vampirovibrionales bacterium]|nr:flagellar basal body P-ring formation chaperone FlgA [Vampirovibrionales bacterium]
MKTPLPLSEHSIHAVHPNWFRWLDRLLCVAIAFTIFQVTIGGLLHGGLTLSAHSAEPNYASDYGTTPHLEITDALFNEQPAPQALASYTAQTSQYSPAPAKTAGIPKTTPAKPNASKPTPTKIATNTMTATPKVAPIPAPVKKTVITPPVASVTHALSKPIPKEMPKKSPPAPTAPIPVAAAAVEEFSLDILPTTPAKTTTHNDDLAVMVPQKRVEYAITAHVKAIAHKQGYFLPATDTIKVEFPYINPTPLTFFEVGLDPNAVQIQVNSSLDQFFTHQSMAKLKLSTPQGEARTIAIPFKVTLTRPVWVVGTTPIAPNQTLQANQFKIEKRELTHDITSVITAQQPLTGKAARLMLNPGMVLHQYQIMTPMMVKSYSQVHMVMSAPNGVHMLLEGKAMEDGRIGDRIRIQNKLNPSKIYTGVVIGDNRVSVKL